MSSESNPHLAVNSEQSLARARKASTSSLKSIPTRLAQSPALKPVSPEVQLDLSSASAQDHPSSISASSRSNNATSATSTFTHGVRTSIIESSQVWRSSAAKRAEKAWAFQTEKALYNDSKFKKYISLVERTLGTFDSVSEWADFISFLSRLLKSFQAYPNYTVIPRKLIVSKRLAQCLNPALPSGVHQRALDVYQHIFGAIGPDGLRRDLQIWTPGLLPFFQYASTSVKPTLLGIYEKHYLPLQQDLRPLVKALLLALLPGLEEETSECFDRTLKLLDSISSSVSDPFFLQCLWLVLMTTPSTRLAALNYLSRRMPKLDHGPDPTLLIGRDVGLMVRAFAHALEDETLLVRRNALELIVTHLKIDRPLFNKCVKSHDKVLLVRAALNVVLRRDLSLNRRLYSWLLGPDESADAQVAYFRTNGLDLVRTALRQDFEADNSSVGQVDRQKPYKIFISLLDKWEIGQSLTRVLILNAFQALSRQMSTGAQDELATTARMLFEVVDPILLFGEFAYALADRLSTAEQGQSDVGHPSSLEPHASSRYIDIESPISLFCFVLKAFHVHDEETMHIHLPLIFSLLLELVGGSLSRIELQETRAADLLDAFELLKLIVAIMPPRVFTGLHLENVQVNGNDKDFLQRTLRFYSSSDMDSEQAVRHFYGFQHPELSLRLVQLCASVTMMCANLPQTSTSLLPAKESFVRMLDILAELFRILDVSQAPEQISVVSQDASEAAAVTKLPWAAGVWAFGLLPYLQSASSFAEVERIVEVLISCAICRAVKDPLDLGAREPLDMVVTKLLAYMEPNMSPYHFRAVELIWATHKVARPHAMETALCRQLSDKCFSKRIRAQQAFGTLWRLSDDLPCDELYAPLMIILDNLRSPDFQDKQLAEAWLRANIRSYTKMIDPLLFSIFNDRAKRTPKMINLTGLQLETLSYTSPFDVQKSNYALQTVLAVSRFSGHGFARAMSANTLSSSTDRNIKNLIGQGLVPSSISYLDSLLDYCIKLIRSYPDESLGQHMQDENSAIQASAVELLQAIVQKVTIQKQRLQELETVLIEAILIATCEGRIEIQNKFLHSLHSVILSRTASQISHHMPERSYTLASTTMEGSKGGENSRGSETIQYPKPRNSSAPHPLLLTMIQKGLSTSSNRIILQHWADFTLMTLPYFRGSVNSLLLPLNDSLCILIQKGIQEIDRAYDAGQTRPTFGAVQVVQPLDVDCSTADADLTLLINMSETVVLQAFGDNASQQSREPSFSTSANGERSPVTTQDGGSGLLGYVSNVFSAEAGGTSAKPSSNTDGRLGSLQNSVTTLHLAWTATQKTLPPIDAKCLSLGAMMLKVKMRCRKAFERLCRMQSAEVIESLVDCWQRAVREGDEMQSKAKVGAAFEILDIIAPSAQIVVTFLCDVLGARTSLADRNRRPASPCSVSDSTLFAFLDAYLTRMESQGAPQVWPVMIMLIKDFVASSTTRKLHIFPVLKIFTTLGEKLCQTTALEDRRIRRDLQENYIKLVDSCILISGRSFDQSTWIRRPIKDNMEEFDIDPSSTNIDNDEKGQIPGVESAGMSVIDSINDFLASRAFPALRKFQIDTDKINSIISNAIYYIVAPNFRTKSKTLEIDSSVVSLSSEIVKMPGTLKTWRATIGDVFQDGRFFSMTPTNAEQWKPIVFSMMTNDRERFIELLGKITSAASANIFTNRELEMLTRALNLRRLSFVIYSGEKDYFLSQLPGIQEKVVDLLRSNVSEVVHAEVYLCMRVLLYRFSSRHLASFWPVIITELIRIFDSLTEELPNDGSDQLQLILSACKFLDLLLLLETEEFQLHQWMFITDTTDVVYPSDDWESESILDRLATIIIGGGGGQHTSKEGGEKNKLLIPNTEISTRIPQLVGTKTIQSIQQLFSFFSNVSLQRYEDTYACLDIDHDSIEQDLIRDMFDGSPNHS